MYLFKYDFIYKPYIYRICLIWENIHAVLNSTTIEPSLKTQYKEDFSMPKDPVMLLSFVNTQLRDNYNTLEELCKSYMISEEEITNKLKSINYEYNTEKNQFI